MGSTRLVNQTLGTIGKGMALALNRIDTVPGLVETCISPDTVAPTRGVGHEFGQLA
jgi:hypothetical protein